MAIRPAHAPAWARLDRQILAVDARRQFPKRRSPSIGVLSGSTATSALAEDRAQDAGTVSPRVLGCRAAKHGA
jgi:hypothetical protein